MSDKIKALINDVHLAGKVAEIEVKTGLTDEKKIPYVSIKGAIQFGDSKVKTRRFEAFVQQEKSAGGENKLYQPTLDFGNKAQSIAKVGYDNATVVDVQGGFTNNDYIDSSDKLVESNRITAKFFNDCDDDLESFKGTADIEGYIQAITEETKGEDQVETGRLRLAVLTTDFFGNVIPIKNIIVPKELHDDFLNGYEVGQTATFYVDFVPNKAEAKPKRAGGLGVQRETDGKSYLEMILTGATPAVDEDDKNAISKEAIKIALAERKAKLNELTEKGYQGKGKDISSSNRNSLGSKGSNASSGKKKPDPVDDEDIPF
jgi:hypothetical protein